LIAAQGIDQAIADERVGGHRPEHSIERPNLEFKLPRDDFGLEVKGNPGVFDDQALGNQEGQCRQKGRSGGRQSTHQQRQTHRKACLGAFVQPRQEVHGRRIRRQLMTPARNRDDGAIGSVTGHDHVGFA